jgi:hypothetical protein
MEKTLGSIRVPIETSKVLADRGKDGCGDSVSTMRGSSVQRGLSKELDNGFSPLPIELASSRLCPSKPKRLAIFCTAVSK